MSDTEPISPDVETDAACRTFVRDFVQGVDLRHLIGLRGFARTLSENWDTLDDETRREIAGILSNQAELLWPSVNQFRQRAKAIVGLSATEARVPRLAVAIRQLPSAQDLPLPLYKTDGAAGMDLYAALDAPLTLAPGERAAVPTGIAIAVPPGYEAQVRARSGLARHHGIAMVNAPGTIDSDYRGEIAVLVINLGSEPVTLARGERIAQLIVAPVVRVEWQPVESLDTTVRGEGGFGHTGRNDAQRNSDGVAFAFSVTV